MLRESRAPDDPASKESLQWAGSLEMEGNDGLVRPDVVGRFQRTLLFKYRVREILPCCLEIKQLNRLQGSYLTVSLRRSLDGQFGLGQGRGGTHFWRKGCVMAPEPLAGVSPSEETQGMAKGG